MAAAVKAVEGVALLLIDNIFCEEEVQDKDADEEDDKLEEEDILVLVVVEEKAAAFVTERLRVVERSGSGFLVGMREG